MEMGDCQVFLTEEFAIPQQYHHSQDLPKNQESNEAMKNVITSFDQRKVQKLSPPPENKKVL